MKAYTDLNQSKKLAEILKWKTADMRYTPFGDTHPWFLSNDLIEKDSTPCWSLAALLNYLREIDFFPNIEADEHGVTMSVCYYDDEEGELLHPMHDITTEEDNFVDACYEMIIKLHEQKLL